MNFNTFENVAIALTGVAAGNPSPAITTAAEKNAFTHSPLVHAEMPATKTTYKQHFGHHRTHDNPHSLRSLIDLTFQ